uniref:Regulator of G protein signaling 14a n=1 Tax=Hucho hucho TaxID=62062 RepID=A0A4W5RGY2_9TELE
IHSSFCITSNTALLLMSPELNVVPEAQGASVGLCSSSNSNLPTVPSEEASGVGKLTSWAVSFERLLQDPTGVLYFTAFLKSEVSAENISFWKSCENASHPINIYNTYLSGSVSHPINIYNTYLSGSASHFINIDDTVRIEERDVRNPKTGTPPWTHHYKFLHMGGPGKRTHNPGAASALLCQLSYSGQYNLLYQGSLENNETFLSPQQLERERWRAAQAENCCVFLPDGTASLAPARAGLSIRTMLTGLCEKRGLPLSDVIIYLQGKDKKPLSLDQDSSVLKEQQVFLELRTKVFLRVEIVATGKTVGIVVTSNETLQEAMTPVLQKQRLLLQDVIVTMSGSRESLSMSTALTSLDKKKLTLDRVKAVSFLSGNLQNLGRTHPKCN